MHFCFLIYIFNTNYICIQNMIFENIILTFVRQRIPILGVSVLFPNYVVFYLTDLENIFESSNKILSYSL